MDYKVKLQNNNNVFRDNNTDLQAVLETINNLPAAGVSENLDEEIATQEEKIASQDELIASIEAALEGKAAGGGAEIDTCTVTLSGGEYTMSLITIENGTVCTTSYAPGLSNYNSLTIYNVICNSMALISPTAFLRIKSAYINEEEITDYIHYNADSGDIVFEIPNEKNTILNIRVETEV